jgi:hypothetical protein
MQRRKEQARAASHAQHSVQADAGARLPDDILTTPAQGATPECAAWSPIDEPQDRDARVDVRIRIAVGMELNAIARRQRTLRSALREPRGAKREARSERVRGKVVVACCASEGRRGAQTGVKACDGK